MPREKPLFRENLERLDAKFPNKEVLSFKEVAEFYGISIITVKRRGWYNPKFKGILKTKLASEMSS